jgi:type IV fimbrial biogenesis protein FimT
MSASSKLAPVELGSMDSLLTHRGTAAEMSPATDNSGQPVRMPRRLRHQAGLNLIELLVVIMIASILMGLGVPSFRYVTNTTRVANEVNELLGDMMIARAEAIKEGQTVSVCPSTNGTSCTTSADWSVGWIVFTDFNANGTVDTDAANNDTIVRYQSKFSGSDTFVVSNLPNNWVSFNRDGFSANLNTNMTLHALFTLHTNPVNTQWTRCLEMQFAGQMTTEHAGTGACN